MFPVKPSYNYEAVREKPIGTYGLKVHFFASLPYTRIIPNGIICAF